MPGEKKNLKEATEWLRSGHPGVADHWKPAVVFTLDEASEPVGNTAVELDLRACANRAAGQPAWRFLSAELRGKLTTLPACTDTIKVAWSGTAAGDAAALDLYHTGTLGLAGGTPCDFVIGNGHRGRDGLVECTRRWLEGRNPGDRAIAICLVGEGTCERPTPAQEAALGELVAWIEARNGCLILTMQQPRDRGLLADGG